MAFHQREKDAYLRMPEDVVPLGLCSSDLASLQWCVRHVSRWCCLKQTGRE